jgi:hypothetical protein
LSSGFVEKRATTRDRPYYGRIGLTGDLVEKRATTRDRPYYGRIGLSSDLENLAGKDGEIPLV